tara:strand:+ start:1196 stop:1837 length:642 start_codon:yes stop_codon:yes gene_type:complete
MDQLFKDFETALSKIHDYAMEVEALKDGIPVWHFRYLSEGLINQLWQERCRFIRELFIKTCNGCVTRNGTVIRARSGTRNTWKHISYDAFPAHIKRRHQNNSISYMSQEPTWGDWDKLPDYISQIFSSNGGNLHALHDSTFIRGGKDLQLVRNACYHENTETMSNLGQINIFYSGKSITFPFEMCWKEENSSKVSAIYKWIDDILCAADLSTQ